MSRLGDSIYLIRIEKGLSQKDLAEKSGVPQPNISSIEKGRDFKISTLYKLASALEVLPTDLIDGVKPISVDKQHFFQRNNIERLVNHLPADHKSESLNQLARTLIVALSRKSKQKDLHLSWIKLRRTFSQEELDAVFSRLNKAKERAEANAVSA